MTDCEHTLTDFFVANSPAIRSFIARRIPYPYQAEDLVQDVFVRLWNVRQTVREQTVKSLVYTVVNNIVADYLRHFICKKNCDNYILYTQDVTLEIMGDIESNDIANLEMRIVDYMPDKRRMVYLKSRYEDKNVDAIAKEMDISLRTVESHLYIARKSVRTALRRCM